ncbi:MAG: hypothetical protein RBS80_12870 [Thermoguttaceae bacterium]|nr:hypothetical protein [Thermoguttaceae bacterium]
MQLTKNEKLRDVYIDKSRHDDDPRERRAWRLRADGLRAVIRLDRRPRMYSRWRYME